MTRTALLLALGGLAAACQGGGATPGRQDGTPVQADHADGSVLGNGVAGPAVDWGWSEVDLNPHFDPQGAARQLILPEKLKGAQVGYYGDPAMLAHYSTKHLAEMRRDGAGFATTLDLDGDGVPETYRTGFWQKGEEDGDFLVVFENGLQRDLIDTRDEATFLSWRSGGLTVSGCNCAIIGDVRYAGGRLRIDWASARY